MREQRRTLAFRSRERAILSDSRTERDDVGFARGREAKPIELDLRAVRRARFGEVQNCAVSEPNVVRMLVEPVQRGVVRE